MRNHQIATRLNGPMVARLDKCAADTSSNWHGKITIYPPEARELTALIAEAAALRSIADGAAYNVGVQECQDGECEHLDDPETGEPCPVLEERYATANDVLRAQAFGEALDEIASLLDGMPDRGLRDHIRSAIQSGKDVVADQAAVVTRPKPEQQYPTGRPGWLGPDQDWPCGRCKQEVSSTEKHDCADPAEMDNAPKPSGGENRG